MSERAPTDTNGVHGRDPHPLRGRTVLVTGAGRRGGIGHAIASLAASYGASTVLHHFQPHDEAQEWGADDLDAVVESVRRHALDDAVVAEISADLADPHGPARLMVAAAELVGHVDVLVCNHALTGEDGPLGGVTAEQLDAHWAVDARSSILLAQAFVQQHDGRPGGSIVFMTSGQELGPLPGEIAYAAAKAAMAGITTTIADELADLGIRVNTVNPGPVDTGYLTDDMWRLVAPMFPFGRYGRPDDPARLIVWLATDEAAWITGQTINTEGGFGRWRPRGPS
ncbi:MULTISPECIES: SDR family oxidoreductase [Pseudonocardia]|uniref:3-oxoacyl-[acyl-carrier-protein] reductase FabG n=2 Tax=Pseudonocardia TaxID=1847 RepID=A0A1Y2MQ91_PSEAH|nr:MULTISPECIES: SDR family oxidoreductase [Pseudonocardia]OSY37390.1 3-oxoacyl-[acyl-carrier-protein] reductase FabG [Pseudonocardia autotrophica]TDN77284.1 3-oxoacyl-[acyl-carrier protein] reductase [Pseudonocardia autotrophica]BBG01304.1 3-ketoacyl-ACP reductase [Pseudonocardia autotrophica]GEC26031.1 3-ketoacyl-ACP reductase [Pseudonocardia saturnea]